MLDVLEKFNKPGYEELAKMINEWILVSKRKGEGFQVVLPNYYFETQNGFPLDSIVENIGDVLEEIDLQNFVGSQRYFLYNLAYSKKEDPKFESLNTLYDIVAHELSAYGRPFEGVLGIDITEWVTLEETGSMKFRAFLEFMAALDDITVAVFIDRANNSNLTRKAFNNIAAYARLEKVRIVLDNAEGAERILKEKLSSLGFQVDDKANKLLIEHLGDILSIPGNESYETLRLIAQELVYIKCKEEENFSTTLTADDIDKYFRGQDWIEAFKIKKKTYRLGLLGE